MCPSNMQKAGGNESPVLFVNQDFVYLELVPVKKKAVCQSFIRKDNVCNYQNDPYYSCICHHRYLLNNQRLPTQADHYHARLV
jgi:hypothetical protein